MHHLPVPKYLEHIFKRLRKEKKEDEAETVEVDSKADGDNEFENEKVCYSRLISFFTTN